jgi:two-component system response regulator MprA
MLRLVFVADGYQVTTATNGREALDAVEASSPRAIVLDLEMPVMDGREFFRELRAKGNSTPVLILSAYGADLARRELKAEAFVSKPFEPDYLVQEVEKLLGRS